MGAKKEKPFGKQMKILFLALSAIFFLSYLRAITFLDPFMGNAFAVFLGPADAFYWAFSAFGFIVYACFAVFVLWLALALIFRQGLRPLLEKFGGMLGAAYGVLMRVLYWSGRLIFLALFVEIVDLFFLVAKAVLGLPIRSYGIYNFLLAGPNVPADKAALFPVFASLVLCVLFFDLATGLTKKIFLRGADAKAEKQELEKYW